MAELKTPIVGDDKYGKKTSKPGGLMLHAYRLTLIHPYSREVFTLESALPDRFHKIISCHDLSL